MSKEGTWRSNTAGRKMNPTCLRKWRPIWFAIGCPSSPRAAPRRHLRQKSQRRPFRSSLKVVVTRCKLVLVASLNRPGDNVTGVSSMNAELPSKQLGLLHELLPQAMRFAVLVNPNYSYCKSAVTDLRVAAGAIGRQIEVLSVSTNRDIDTVFASLAQKQSDALLVSTDTLFINRYVQLVTLATRHAVPA